MVDISVIIPAHNRKTFLRSAVESVLNQNLPRDNYEIVVVKNFVDEEIDGFLKENRVVDAYTEVQSLGGKIAVAMNKCRGKILSFLEDDDIWKSDKLMRVLQSFSDGVVFYHNSFALINSKGEVISYPNHPRKAAIMRSPKKGRTAKDIRRLLNYSAANNVSSISILRSTLEEHASKLIEINMLFDNFLFFAGLDVDGIVVADTANLTSYRVHDSNTNFLGNWEVYSAKWTKHSEDLIKGNRYLSTLFGQWDTIVLGLPLCPPQYSWL